MFKCKREVQIDTAIDQKKGATQFCNYDFGF